MTFLTGILCFALWIPAKSFGVLTFFSILSGSMLGIYWPALGPVATEVVGLKDLPSVLSLSWMSIVLPTTCKSVLTMRPQSRNGVSNNGPSVSEVIALKLRRPNTSHAYLYPQIFAGLSYLGACLCMLELSRILRKKRKPAEVAFRPSDSTLVEATKQSVEDVEKCER